MISLFVHIDNDCVEMKSMILQNQWIDSSVWMRVRRLRDDRMISTSTVDDESSNSA